MANGKRKPTETDKKAGRRARERRKTLGMSQKEVAEALGVSERQYQRYEAGVNSMSADSIKRLTNKLRAPANFFFDGENAA